MLQKLFYLSLLVVISAAQAASLTLSLPYQAKPYQTITIRSTFVDDQGQSHDVSSEVRIECFDLSPRGSGQYEVNFPRSMGYSTSYSTQVYATYNSADGAQSRAQATLWVDLTPEFLEIQGPWSVASGSGQNYRAWGSYSARRVELTQYGSWRANYGSITNFGLYYAPTRPGNDTISFNYGNRWQYYNIRIW